MVVLEVADLRPGDLVAPPVVELALLEALMVEAPCTHFGKNRAEALYLWRLDFEKGHVPSQDAWRCIDEALSLFCARIVRRGNDVHHPWAHPEFRSL